MMEFIKNFPPELQIFLLAMMPIIELRGAIPFGIFALGLNPILVFVLAVLGNLTPNVFILWALPHVAKPLRRRFGIVDRFLKRTHDKHSAEFKEKGAVFIVLFVGIPIPGSGSWTGSILAYLFDLEFKKSLLCISLGVLMAGLIVLTGSLGLFQIILAYLA